MTIIEIPNEMFSLLICCLIGFVLGEVLIRIHNIYTNFLHSTKLTICQKKYFCEQMKINQPNNLFYTLLVVLSIFLSTKYLYAGLHVTTDGFMIVIFNAILYWTQKYFKIFESKSDLIKFIQAGGGLDYGSGMAYSFFYGYLNKILPDNGDNNVGIRENIEKYEANENIIIPVKRLFILIPISMYFAPSLADHSGIIEACKSLESIIRNVAGIVGRSYKNSVYKIHLTEMEGRVQKPLYVVAEGATPLHTLYQTCMGKAPCSAHIKEHSEEIVRQFYNTLSKILESLPEYKNTYELVLYEGTENLAELLVERIRNSEEFQAYNKKDY